MMIRQVSCFTVLYALVTVIVTLCTNVNGSPALSRGLQVTLPNTSGINEQVTLYKGSFALLVGASKYRAGWPVLPSVPAEINQVEKLLQEQGFHVEKIMDPDGATLEAGYRKFINDYGLERENRLLFYFSGHGHTRKGGKKGYLVPIDAPDPQKDMTVFLQKALGMNQILSWARDIEAKHALFLFDSCFSGTIFKQKSRISPPAHITRLTVEPVRQFITAGSAGEEVPAKSTFAPTFIEALRYGRADLNGDGYVSATELGLHLQTELSMKTEQNPQFGKIRDYDLARGDFIFLTGVQSPPTNAEGSTDGTTVYASAGNAILRVDSSPPGASVYIDGIYQGNTPILLDNVTPGTHRLRAEKKGFLSETKSIKLEGATQVSVLFQFIALTAEGSLTVNTNPAGAKVSILEYQKDYVPGILLPAGNYSVEVSKYGFSPEVAHIQIHEREDLVLNITLNRQITVATPGNQEVEQQTYLANGSQYGPETNTEPNSTVSIKPQKRKIVFKKEPVLPDHISQYIKDLRSSNSGKKRNAAKTIYKKKIHHPAILEAVEDELLSGSTRNLEDRYHVDAMAWLCNILGSSENRKYKKTLNHIANSNSNRKIRKFAQKNLRKLSRQ